MPTDPPVPPKPLTDFGLLPGERPAVPQAEASDSIGAWENFERFSREWKAPPSEHAFAPTEPAPLMRSPAPVPPAPRPAGNITLEQALIEVRRFNRVCPRPEHWQRLYEMLPNKVMTGRQPHPAPPILDSAWRAVPALPKRLCLRDHLEWAESQGVLDAVMLFLKSLREEDWHHMGD